ncbi:hypothetical protein [Actinomadura sp. 7K507]|uniref:hypothetical protein n=1 Tax=Actinomadura sp. 7K507 TaxID=2530365 RepID=UPI00105305B5|nr:hypothetical protein [Actinomadura sp. 7K507]TDC82166.1 hypothetical protein E1285_31245 [Actinomadura sp. 7K507]
MSYRTVMSVDLQGYGSASQNVQRVLQENLVECLREAAVNAGLDSGLWADQGSGDGKLMVLPFGVSVEVLVGRFVRELNAELRGRNRVSSREARTRMRLAIHHGPAAEASNGYSGSAPVVVTRLCGAEPLRKALEEAGTDLGVIVSAFVFRGSIEAGMTSLDAETLRRVRLPDLGNDADAWIWLPGGPDPHTLDSAEEPVDPPSPSGPPEEPAETPPWDGFRGTTIYAPRGTVIGRDQNNHYWGRP